MNCLIVINEINQLIKQPIQQIYKASLRSAPGCCKQPSLCGEFKWKMSPTIVMQS